MALQNHPAIYSGGNERLNSRPHVLLYAQLMQRKQANRDAFDEYIRNLNMKVNPSGMRNNERGVFEDKLKKWQEYGIQNKEALRNPRKDNGLASMNFQSGFQDLQNLISRSKGIEELKKPGVEVITNQDKFDRANKDKLKKGFYDTDQDLYVKNPTTGQWEDNPAWKPFNPAEHIEYDEKPFEQDKFSQGLDDIKESQSSQTIKALDGFKEEVTTTSIFSPESKENIAYRSIGQFGQDKGFQKFIKDLPQKERDVLKNLYETEFDEPATDDAHLAVAYGLKIKQQNSIKKEIRDDKFAQDKYLAELRHSNALALKRTPGAKAEGSEDDSLYLEQYWDEVTDKALANKSREQLGDVFRGGEYPIELDPTIAKAFARQGIEPEEITVNDKGVVTPKYYENVLLPDGKTTKKVLLAELSRPLTRTQALLALGVKATTGKQRYKEGKSVVSEKPKPKKDPLGLF